MSVARPSARLARIAAVGAATGAVALGLLTAPAQADPTGPYVAFLSGGSVDHKVTPYVLSAGGIHDLMADAALHWSPNPIAHG